MPLLDEHLLPEDSPYEIIDGRRILTMGNPEHAGPQIDLGSVLRMHAVEGYRAMVELTTRADTLPPPPDMDPNAAVLPRSVNELRSDASILKSGIDPRTNDRYVEDLSFEIANEQSLAALKVKARKLSDRGVRRVFGVLVKKRMLLEWSPQRADFEILQEDQQISDPCLRLPIRVKALLDAAEADVAIAQALITRKHPVIEDLRQKERDQGHTQGIAETLLRVLNRRGVAVDDISRQRILGCTVLPTLERWADNAAVATQLTEVWTEER